MAHFWFITTFMILAIIAPGPDFFVVTKNALTFNKRAGIYTSIGVACGSLILALFAISKLAIIINDNQALFNILKLIGATYLIYLGAKEVFSKSEPESNENFGQTVKPIHAFKQGLVCSTLNPKAIIFFLALFTVIIKPNFPTFSKLGYVVEASLLYLCWFIFLSVLITHPHSTQIINKIKGKVTKIMGAFLIILGLDIIFHVW